MNRLLRPAHFALDFAAPVEGAGAALHHLFHLRPVASAAAHQVASIHSDARLVAHSSLSARNAQFGVLLAEIRRILVVDEIFL